MTVGSDRGKRKGNKRKNRKQLTEGERKKLTAEVRDDNVETEI